MELNEADWEYTLRQEIADEMIRRWRAWANAPAPESDEAAP